MGIAKGLMVAFALGLVFAGGMQAQRLAISAFGAKVPAGAEMTGVGGLA
jgi:hypothetical protein